jgi:hypothetical protein
MHLLITPFWNRKEQRLRAFWRIALLVVLFGVLTIAIAFFGRVLTAGWLLNVRGYSSLINLMNVITLPIAAVLSMWLAARFLDRRPFADFGLHLNARWWLDLSFGLLLGAVLMGSIFLAELSAGWLRITGSFQTVSPAAPFGLAILEPLVLFVCVGIYEEMLVRGYLLRNLAEGWRFPRIGARGALLLAWLASSLLFGLLHAGNPNATLISTLNISLGGLFLGLGYVLTGELAIPIGVHITWNFFQGNVFGFPVSGGTLSRASFISIEQGGPPLWTGGAFGPEAGLVGVLAMLVGSLLTLLWVRMRQQRLALHLPLAQPSLLHSTPQQDAA